MEVPRTLEDAIAARDACVAHVALADSEIEARKSWRRAKALGTLVREMMREDRSHQGSVLPTRADWEGSSTRVFEG